eukprot:10264264-Alexandrium_andersonii.AAC.1
MLWLIEHAGELLTKRAAGHDGRTPYERVFGKTSAARTGARLENLCAAECGRRSLSAGWARAGKAASGWEGGG